MNNAHLRPAPKDLLDPFTLRDGQQVTVIDRRNPHGLPVDATVIGHDTHPTENATVNHRQERHGTLQLRYDGPDGGQTTVHLSSRPPSRGDGTWVGHIEVYRQRRRLTKLISLHREKATIAARINSTLAERDPTIEQLQRLLRLVEAFPRPETEDPK